MERLTYKTNGKYINTTTEQAPQYAIDCDIDTAITKLAEYEDLEEHGKMLKLPCAVGDTVWKIDSKGKLSNCKVSTIRIEKYGGFFCNAIYICCLSDFGKTVFLTREEAEATLQKIKKGLLK